MARSLLFNLLFYVTTTLFVVLGSPLLFAPRRWAMAALAVHSRFELWLLKVVVGTRLEVRGQEKLPKGACLVASKHQSAWETFALIPLFRDPALLMKRELFWIPFHGWFSRKFEMIPVDRDKGPAALRRMLREARKRVADGREIIIFPEGTRRPPGAPPDYKTGVILLYEALGIRAYRSPSIPGCFGQGEAWNAGPAPSWSSSSIPFRRACRRPSSSRDSPRPSRPPQRAFWPKQRPRNPALGRPLTFECLTGARPTFYLCS